MGQIIVNKNLIGTVSLGLFLLVIGAFAFGAVDPLFRPIAIGSFLGGVILAGLLLRRRRQTPHIDPSQVDGADSPRPIEPR